MFCPVLLQHRAERPRSWVDGRALLPVQHGLSGQPGPSWAVSLNGIKFWIAGDLGADFSKGAEWAEITFEPSVTKEQRDAITTIVPHVYPVTWKSFTVGSDARDRLDRIERSGGGAPRTAATPAEVVLRRFPGMTQDPVIDRQPEILRRAAQRPGFILMPNEIDAYRVGTRRRSSSRAPTGS